jgi:hypothetical protein
VKSPDRHLAVVPEILGHEDRGHATALDLGFDRSADGRDGLQAFQQVGHACLLRNEGGAMNIQVGGSGRRA